MDEFYRLEDALQKTTRFVVETDTQEQSMRNLVCRRSMSGKTCLRLVEILGSPVTITGNFCQILSNFVNIQWYDR